MGKKLYVILGFPGVGKTELCEYLDLAHGIKRIKTCTSKPSTRWDHDKYRFMSPEEFNRRESAGELKLVRTVKFPSGGDYLFKTHKYGTSSCDLEKGGSIILNWDGYTDILSTRQEDVIAILLDIPQEEILERLKEDGDTRASILDAEARYASSLKENAALLDSNRIHNFAMSFPLYILDASLPKQELHELVDIIVKEN